MLTSIEIENFKGVATRQRIEFAPLTLLFGANSAGKSTLLHALAYVLNTVRSGGADIVAAPQLHGAHLLPGFARVVHNHDTSATMKIRVAYRSGASFNVFHRTFEDTSLAGILSDMDDGLESVWIELEVAFAPGIGSHVASVQVGTEGTDKPILVIRRAELHPQWIAILSAEHPLLAAHRQFINEATGEPDPKDRFHELWLQGQTSALPPLGKPLRIVAEDDDEPEDRTDRRHLWEGLLEMLALGVQQRLVDQLEDMVHVGPIRIVPGDELIVGRSLGGRWFDGSRAWEALGLWGGLLEHTNQWLQRLEAGCTVVKQRLHDTSAPAEASSSASQDGWLERLMLRDGNGTLMHPREVGTGMAQVIPIIAACWPDQPPDGAVHLVACEQPELHVHPAMQARMGDMLIEASVGQQLIIETHSEHMILRVLRRIRETNAQDLPDDAPAFSPDKLSVLYVESSEDGTRVRRLRVDETGEFMDRWPKGFFEERAEELF